MRKTSPDAGAASYTKDQLLRSKKYAARRDLLGALLEDGKTYPEIQQVLGHASPDTARHYIRVEANRLRECAIEVPAFPNELIAYFRERR